MKNKETKKAYKSRVLAPWEIQKLMQQLYGYGPIRLYTTAHGDAVLEVEFEGQHIEVLRTQICGGATVDHTIYPLGIADTISGVIR